MDQIFLVAQQLIENMFGISVQVLADKEDYERFCREYTLLPVQQFFNPDNLHKLADSMQEADVYHVQDQLQIDLAILRMNQKCVVLGPFCTRIFSRSDCMRLLRKLNLPEDQYGSLLSYRDRFPVLKVNHILNIADSLMQVMTKQEYHFHNADYTQIGSAEDIRAEEEALQQQYLQFIREHYAVEQQFMRSVETGNRVNALIQMEYLQRKLQSFKKLGTTLENERIASAIVRTMVRVAAMRAGLPILTVDLLSRNNTVATQKATSVDQIHKDKEKMIQEFCDAIQKHREQEYGNLVSSIAFYMENQYSEPITMAQLAREFHISQNYLTNLFHKEMGETPTNYLRKIRTEKAKQLLLTTDLSVQQISEKIGIDDSNYFVKLFRKDFGTTPTQYRKQYKA